MRLKTPWFVVRGFVWPVSECPQESRPVKAPGGIILMRKLQKISSAAGWKMIILNKTNGDTRF